MFVTITTQYKIVVVIVTKKLTNQANHHDNDIKNDRNFINPIRNNQTKTTKEIKNKYG